MSGVGDEIEDGKGIIGQGFDDIEIGIRTDGVVVGAKETSEVRRGEDGRLVDETAEFGMGVLASKPRTFVVEDADDAFARGELGDEFSGRGVAQEREVSDEGTSEGGTDGVGEESGDGTVGRTGEGSGTNVVCGSLELGELVPEGGGGGASQKEDFSEGCVL